MPTTKDPELKTQTPSEVASQLASDFLVKKYAALAYEFQKALISFGPHHPALAHLTDDEREALLFMGSGAAVTEFILLDALLMRNPGLKVAIDFIDPVYDGSTSGGDSSPEGVANILLSSLSQKYSQQILSWQLRNENFSTLPNELQSMKLLFNEQPSVESQIYGYEFTMHKSLNEKSALTNKPSSLFNPIFLRHLNQQKRIMVLAAFDLEDGMSFCSGTKSFKIVRDILLEINQAKIDQQGSVNLRRIFPAPLSWQLVSILVGNWKIALENPILLRK